MQGSYRLNDFDDDMKSIEEIAKYRKERVLEKIETEWAHTSQKIAKIFAELLDYHEYNKLTECERYVK